MLLSVREKKTGECSEKEKIFCKEYIKDFNKLRAYKAAGYKAKNEKAAAVNAYEISQFPRVRAYIKELQANLEEVSGISRLKVLQEYANIAFSSIAHFHNTWIDVKAFDALTAEQKSCIAGITTSEVERGGKMVPMVHLTLHSKNKALDAISRMLGFDSPQKIDLTSMGEKLAHAPEIKVYNTAPPLASSEEDIEVPKKHK